MSDQPGDESEHERAGHEGRSPLPVDEVVDETDIIPSSSDFAPFIRVEGARPLTEGVGYSKPVPPTHEDETRRGLALIVIVGMLVLYGAITAAFLLRWMPRDDFTAAIAGISGVQTLAAAILGFYFGGKSGKKED
ncbi:hypothetical protein [Sinomonas humi]|uniref:Uncharacterized protein n=1 Tax=Sinomonas humi TaxID=1338436 RepID=A0A0B2AES5_9MICC|nr:hypothetical protein [Sinomonas humi]KHL00231.1 hypothetical protein LK10_20685 [Sinomonas humi]